MRWERLRVDNEKMEWVDGDDSSPMTIDIRPAEIEDFAAVDRLYKELDQTHIEEYPELFVDHDGPARPFTYLERLISGQSDVLLVAETNEGEIVGLLEASILENDTLGIQKGRVWTQLSNIIVSKPYQQMGIGEMLLDELVYLCHETGIDRIELSVYAFNEGALNFYTKAGFKPLKQEMALDLSDNEEG